MDANPNPVTGSNDVSVSANVGGLTKGITYYYRINANNIATQLNTAYSPAAPDAQQQWMVDLTAEVMASGGSGVIYWEPAWVSSSCWTQWGEGSHGEHLAFFDFENNLILDGGIAWMSYDYTTALDPQVDSEMIKLWLSVDQSQVSIDFGDALLDSSALVQIIDLNGRLVKSEKVDSRNAMTMDVSDVNTGIYVATVLEKGIKIFQQKIQVVK